MSSPNQTAATTTPENVKNIRKGATQGETTAKPKREKGDGLGNCRYYGQVLRNARLAIPKTERNLRHFAENAMDAGHSRQAIADASGISLEDLNGILAPTK